METNEFVSIEVEGNLVDLRDEVRSKKRKVSGLFT